MWKKFEQDCFDYIAKNINSLYQVRLDGSSNSMASDIFVHNTSNNENFYIEAKKIPSQSSQFVVLPNLEKKEFYFSENNKKTETSLHLIFIQYMNEHYEDFLNAGTKGKEIFLDENIFYQFIKQDYESKGIKYIVCNNMHILKISDLENHFNVSCCYRIKKSGSSSPSLKKHEEITSYLFNNFNIPVENIEVLGKKKDFIIKGYNQLSETRFNINNDNYILKVKDDNCLRVRLLSNTKNGNIIFKLTLKKERPESIKLEDI